MKMIVMKLTRIVFQFILGSLFAFLAAALIYLFGFLLSGVEVLLHLPGFVTLNLLVLLIIFVGFPIGSMFGILLADKKIFRLKGYNVPGVIVGTIFSMYVSGLIPLFPLPFITVLCSLIGYNIVRIFIADNRPLRAVFALHNIILFTISSLFGIGIYSYLGSLRYDYAPLMITFLSVFTMPPILIALGYFLNRPKRIKSSL